MINAGLTTLPWQPYQSKNAPISLTEPLYGIGDVRDRITCRDGVWGVERQLGTQIFDGRSEQKWFAVLNNDGANYRNVTSFIKAVAKANGKALCTAFARADGVTNSLPGFKLAGDASVITYSDNFSTSDVSLWTAYLKEHPMTIVYELDTPTWTPLPSDTQSALNALTTYTGTTHVTITAGGPEPDVTMEYYGQPGDKTNVQSMLDALAHKVALELVSNTALAQLLTGYIAKSCIKNTGLVTEEGFVADARQLNPDIADTLAAKVKKNEEDITNQNSNLMDLSSAVDGIYLTNTSDTPVAINLPYTMTKNGWIRIRSSNADVTVMANGMAIYRGINTTAVVPLAAGTVISASVATGLTIGLVQ